LTFSEAALIELSKWENWRWAISTSITIISIFGAAFWAQSIFNRKALQREDRDRKLNSLIAINDVIFSIQSDIEITQIDLTYLMLKYNNLNMKMLHIQTLINLHGFGLKNSFDLIEEGLKEYSDFVNELKLSDPTDEKADFDKIVKERVIEIIRSRIIAPLDQMLLDIVEQFHEIEKHT